MLPVLVDVLAFVALPYAVWRCCGRVVPLAVLPILTGLALAVLGDRLGTGMPFVPTAAAEMAGWAGVLVLAFVAGLESRAVPASGAGAGRMAATALAALSIPCALGTLAALALLSFVESWRPAAIGLVPAALAIGLCLAVSALPVLVGIVRELPAPDRPLGQMALRLAAIDDAALWAGLGALMLAVRLDGAAAGWADVLAVAVLLGLAVGWRRLARWRPAPVVVWSVAAIWLAAGAWSTGTLGLHALLGAYVAGVLLPAAVAAQLPAGRLGLLVLTLLAPLFFGHRGLAIDASVFGWGALAAAFGLMVLAVASKVGAVLLLPPVAGMARRDRLALGSLLQCKGLMEIVAATMLRDQGMLTETAYAALVTLAVLSTALTMPLFRLVRRGARSGAEPRGAASYIGMP